MMLKFEDYNKALKKLSEMANDAEAKENYDIEEFCIIKETYGYAITDEATDHTDIICAEIVDFGIDDYHSCFY